MNRFDKVFEGKRQANSQQEALKSASAVVKPLPDKILDCQKDPRPDLEADHELWISLLTAAKEHGDEDLFGVLHCLRCLGASLEKGRDIGLLIKCGACSKAEYEEFRDKYLAPRREKVVEVLKAAAKRLPEVQRDTLRARIAARVKAVEAHAKSLGWTHQDLWAEKMWISPDDGRQRRSLFVALLSASQNWGNAEVGEITAETAEIVLPALGGSKASLRLYKVSPAAQPASQPQILAPPKKEKEKEAAS